MPSFTIVFSTIVAVLAIFIGLLISPIPKNLGLYRWIASKKPVLIGLSPAFHHGIPWKYTFDELYANTLKGQRALVTGANSGVGYETSLALGRLGASVTLACRNPKKCETAAQEIRNDSRYGGGKISTMLVDTSSLRSVQKFSRDYVRIYADKTLDILYLNAGIGSSIPEKDNASSLPLSEDGIEKTFATNYVGHHLMYKILEPLLLKSSMARVVMTSSANSFDTFPYKVATSLETLNSVDYPKEFSKIYGQSKLAQILWAKELTRRLGSTNSNVYVNAVHPGAVDTGIWRKHPLIPEFLKRTLIKWLRKNAMWTGAEGALTMLYLGVATDELIKNKVRGKYFHPQAQEVINPLALDESLQKELWKFSDDLVSNYSGRVA